MIAITANATRPLTLGTAQLLTIAKVDVSVRMRSVYNIYREESSAWMDVLLQPSVDPVMIAFKLLKKTLRAYPRTILDPPAANWVLRVIKMNVTQG